MKNTLYKLDHIRTYSGQYVNLLDPHADTINLYDIAHSLSNQCRFAGHTTHFYSVAEHCLNCAVMGEPKIRLALLMHDAAEAYLLDIPRPLKALMPQYEDMEDKFLRVISKKFKFKYPFDKEVIDIDNFMLEYEWNNYVNNQTNSLYSTAKSQKYVEESFIKIYHQLIEGSINATAPLNNHIYF